MKINKFNHINHTNREVLTYDDENAMELLSAKINPRVAHARSFVKRCDRRAERRVLNRLTQEEVTDVTVQCDLDFRPILNPQYRVKRTEWVNVGSNEFMPIYPENRHACIAAVMRKAIWG